MSVELTKPRNRRQEIWNYLRRHKERFQTTAEIAESCDLQAPAVYAYLQCLHKAGYVGIQYPLGYDKRYGYRLERDCGTDAPRLKTDGTAARCGIHEALWRTMKILKTFDFDCLIAHVRMTHDVSRDMVKYYTLALERAGYLKNTGSARKKSFVLLKNTGSKAPYVMAVKEVYDPNLDEIVLRDVPEYE